MRSLCRYAPAWVVISLVELAIMGAEQPEVGGGTQADCSRVRTRDLVLLTKLTLHPQLESARYGFINPFEHIMK
jgi:hypothetical protein